MAVFRFADFKFDTEKELLSRRGDRVPLQGAPARMLCALIDADGAVVSRAALCEAAWPDRTVAYEESLHTAIKQLRQALDDDARNPKFVATVPRRGYRFLAQIESLAPAPMMTMPFRHYAALLLVGMLTYAAWSTGAATHARQAQTVRQYADFASAMFKPAHRADGWSEQRRVWMAERQDWQAERARWAAEHR